MPGSPDSPELEDGAEVRGADPPRLEQLLSQGFDIFERVADLLDQLGLDDREKLKAALSNLVTISEDLRVITGEVRGNISPMMADLRLTLHDAQPLLTQAQVVLRDLNNITSELGQVQPAQKQEVKDKLHELLASVDSLTATIARLDRITAQLEQETQGLTRDEISRAIRELLQQEGITINVGSMAGKPNYSRLPPAP